MNEQSAMAPAIDHRAADLIQKIKSRQAKIGVIGLGYVGLPLVQVFWGQGFPVTGFDVDPDKISRLSTGESYIGHIPSDSIRALNESGRFSATNDFAHLSAMDALLICVPTPLSDDREPDLSYVVSTAETIAGHLRAGQVVILESTTYPGTSVDVMRPILEQGGLRSGADFFLAYSPEREDPGNPEFSTARIPKVVGGDGTDATDIATALYGEVVVQVVPVSTTQAAEAVKLTENIFRAVNIALVNELKQIYGAMGIDVWEVIEAAKSKPFGFMPFYPGPGLGGHCIPIDPFYLSWRARQFGSESRFIELAGEINTAMPTYVVDKLDAALQARHGRGLAGAKILVVGLAYKKNVDDIRESPGLGIMNLLESRGASAGYHDPYIAEIMVTRDHPALAGRQSVSWTPATIAEFDGVLICTDHDCLDWALLVDNARLVVDTRNAISRAGLAADHVIKA